MGGEPAALGIDRDPDSPSQGLSRRGYVRKLPRDTIQSHYNLQWFTLVLVVFVFQINEI